MALNEIHAILKRRRRGVFTYDEFGGIRVT